MSKRERRKRRKRIFIFVRLFQGIFRDFYKETRLARKKGINTARQRMARRHRKRAIQFRTTALQMGGVLIKLGQFFSSRVDVMPAEYIEELAKLQDMVPPVPYEDVKQLIETQFNKPIAKLFKSFEQEPSGSASLAQVHYATLPDSTPVAVKVQRPDIEDLINVDLATFSYLMDGVNKFTSFGKKVDIPTIIEEFNRTLGDELDFIREADNALRFKESFKNYTNIFIPEVYESHTSDKIITLEKIEGIKINNYEALEKRGIDRSVVAKEVAQSYFKQILEDGFFHADPHPGNLFVVEGPEITFVDFGMVGEVTAEAKENLKQLALGVAARDVDRIINAFVKLGFLRRGVGSFSVKNAIRWMLDNYSSITTNTLSIEDIEEINEDLKKIMRDEPFTIPADFAFLGRALGTLNGLATGLDPNFNAVEAITPYVKKLTQSEAPNMLNVYLKEGFDALKLLITLPRKFDEVLSSAQKGNLKLKVDSKEIVDTLDRLNKNQRITALAVITAVSIAAAVYLLKLNFTTQSYVLFGVSGLLTLYVLISGRRKKRRYF